MTDNLETTGIEASVIEFDPPTVKAKHQLRGKQLTASPIVITAPSISQFQDLVALGIDGEAPQVGSPDIGRGISDLATSGIDVTISLGTPILSGYDIVRSYRIAVGVDDRRLVVRAETRRLCVPGDLRRSTVRVDSRVISATRDNRRIRVPFDDRYVR